MRSYLILILLLCTTCNNEPDFIVEGRWELERLESIEEYELYNINYGFDTSFNSASLYFDDGLLWTILDDTVTQISILGFQYSNAFVFTYIDLDTSLCIGTEEWNYLVKSNTNIVIENKTVYGIVGSQVRTLYLSRK